MNKLNLALGGLLVVVGVLVGLYLNTGTTTVMEKFGASAGPVVFGHQFFLEGFTSGGNVLATSTSGTATTLSEKDLDNSKMFQMNPLTASFTYTLPATSTLSSILPSVGDTRTWVFMNATSSTGITLTLAKGAGWDLTGVDANVDVIAGAAAGSEVYMGLNCTRKPNRDIVCMITENVAAD